MRAGGNRFRSPPDEVPLPTFESRKLSALADQIRASGAAGRRNDPIVGLVWVTIAMAAFAGLGAFAKYAIAAGQHPLEVIFLRNLFCVLLMLPLLAMRGRSLLTSSQPALYVGRIGLAFVAMMAWFSSLALIPFAELTAISFLSPLFATLFAVLYFGEVVRARRWTALLIGFLGAMIILRPGGSAFGAGQMFALVSALASGIIGPLLKQMTAEDDADKIVFLSNLGLMVLSLVPALFVWQWPALELWPVLVAMGLCAVIGHVALMRGFASTDASLVFTFEFSRLPFAALIGWLFFAEPTDVWTWVGALIIFCSAAYITRREARLKRDGGGCLRDLSDPLCFTPVRLRFSD
jgi:drug/metabolite transporter (DMT)-like permease